VRGAAAGFGGDAHDESEIQQKSPAKCSAVAHA
jgi:hypothetical protein